MKTSINTKNMSGEEIIEGFVEKTRVIRVSATEMEVVSSMSLPEDITYAKEYLRVYSEAIEKTSTGESSTQIKIERKEYDDETIIVGFVGRRKVAKISIMDGIVEVVSSMSLPESISEARIFIKMYKAVIEKAESIVGQ